MHIRYSASCKIDIFDRKIEFFSIFTYKIQHQRQQKVEISNLRNAQMTYTNWKLAKKYMQYIWSYYANQFCLVETISYYA